MKFRDVIYIKKRYIVRSLPNEKTIRECVLDIRPITHINIPDAQWFNSDDQIQCFYEFLKSGYKGFFVYINGVVAHRIWVFSDSKRSIVDEGFLYKIEPNLIVTWGLTQKEYQKQGIYRNVLSYLRQVFHPQLIYGVVLPKNKTSINGLLSSGFEVYQNLILLRFFKLKIWIQYKKQNKMNLKFGFSSWIS